MVEQQNGSSYTQIVYKVDGSKLALMNGQTLNKAYVPLPGGGEAVYTGSGLAYYEHGDWLGTSRLASTPSRSVLWQGSYAPFGESFDEYSANYTYHNFTGQREDTEQGLDDFMFREYSVAQQGRWISPDPAGLAAVDLTDPQSWNRYAYLADSPLNQVDLLGFGSHKKGSDQSGNVGWSALDLLGAGIDDFGNFGPYQPPSVVSFYLNGILMAAYSIQGPTEVDVFTDSFVGTMDSGSSTGGLGSSGGGGTQKTLTQNFLNLDNCIKNNADSYSVGGLLNLGFNTNLPGSSLLGGNTVTDTALLFTGQLDLESSIVSSARVANDAQDALNTPIMTNGPSSFTTIVARRGSPQPVLGAGKNYNVSFLGKVAKFGSAVKGVADISLSGALVVDCLAGAIQ